MKKVIFIVCILCFPNHLFSQVGINTTEPSPASVLDINSKINTEVYGGLLPPRVSIAERNLIIPNPLDDGLMIFLNEGNTRCLQIWDGVQMRWENLYCIPINAAPTATAVTFSGVLQPGNDLTATFGYNDTDGDPPGMHIYKWYSADDIMGTSPVLLQEGISNIYNLKVSDIGKFIAVEVIPVAASGTSPGMSAISLYQGPILVDAIQTLLSWDFFGTPGNQYDQSANFAALNISDGIISRGTGITASINANRFNADNYTQLTAAAAFTNNDYFQFTITPSLGKEMSITQIRFNFEKSTGGPPSGFLRSSVDNFTSDLDTYSNLLDIDSRTSTISGINGRTSTITFRLYLYGNAGVSGSAGFEGSGADLIITGSAF